MSLRRTLEQSLFTMGNRLAEARADVERWLSEPAAACRALDLSQLEDRVMLSASPAAQAILSEAPVAAVDDALPSGDPAIAAESQSILLSANTPDVPAAADGTDQTGDESPPEAPVAIDRGRSSRPRCGSSFHRLFSVQSGNAYGSLGSHRTRLGKLCGDANRADFGGRF